MPTLGSTAERDGFVDWSGINTLNQVAMILVMPEAGTITDVGVWAAGKDADVSAKVALWHANGSLLASSALFTMAGRALAVGANDLYQRALVTPYDAPAGNIYAGFARNPGGAAQWGYDSGGTHIEDTLTSGWPGSLTGFQSHAGTIGVYLIYEVGQEVWVRRSGVWVKAESVQVRRAGAWVDATGVAVRRGGAWVDT